MISFKQFLNEAKTTKQIKKYKPTTLEGLKNLVEDRKIHLGDIDVSEIKDMTRLFYKSKRVLNEDFEGIEDWDVSNLRDTTEMFYACYFFNRDISKWNVSNLRRAEGMFKFCQNFNQNISKWNTVNLINMREMFFNCSDFNQDLRKWNVKNVKSAYMSFVLSKMDKLKCPRFDISPSGTSDLIFGNFI